jgi:hypothetical protein
VGKIIYNNGLSEVGFRLKPVGESFVPSINNKILNLTGDGNTETIVDFFSFMLSFDAHISELQWEEYMAWFAWSAQGKVFAVQFEDTAWATTVNTDQSDFETIWVESIADISPGDVFFIRSPSTLEFEINTVGSVQTSPGPHIIIQDSVVNPLKYQHPAGSTIRFSRYFPALVATKKAKEFASKRSLAQGKTLEGYRSVSLEGMEKIEHAL